jgi:hypothetical protein
MGNGDLVTADPRRGVAERFAEHAEGLTHGQRADALELELLELRRQINQLELQFAELTEEYLREAQAAGDETAYDDLMHHAHMSAGRLGDSLAIGGDIERIPECHAALEAGEIGIEHLAGLARVAHNASTVTAFADVFDEKRLLAQAKRESVRRFRSTCASVQHALDSAAMLEEQNLATLECRLSLKSHGDGSMTLKGWLDAVSAAPVRTIFDALARRGEAGDDRPRELRNAQALVEMSEHALNAGIAPTRHGVRPHVSVIVTDATLLSIPGSPAADVEHAGAVAGATAQRLACDATVTVVRMDAQGNVRHVERGSRRPSAATRREVEVRDRGCVWPGCDRSVSWTTAHHVDHWEHLGPSRAENLALLCRRHHWLVHEGGWTVYRTAEGVISVPPTDRQFVDLGAEHGAAAAGSRPP